MTPFILCPEGIKAELQCYFQEVSKLGGKKKILSKEENMKGRNDVEGKEFNREEKVERRLKDKRKEGSVLF